MQNDSFKCVSIMRRIIGVKDPTEELLGIYFSLWSWDISLALNMTYFFYLSLRQCRVSDTAAKIKRLL